MKLYTKPMAPNGLRVTMFAAKKGIALDVEMLGWGDAGDPAYLALNPTGQVPTLVLDDGSTITESLTICQYLDTLGAGPALFGDTPADRLRIAMWERRAEFQLFLPAVEYGHHVHPMFAQAIPQFPDWAATQVPRVERFLGQLRDRLVDQDYLAGPAFSVADITAYYGVRMAMFYGLYPEPADVVSGWLARIDA